MTLDVVHTIYRGTDLRLTGALQNEDETPVDLTGSTVALSAASLPGALVSVTSAATGAILITAEWSDDWPDGRQSQVQVIVTSAGGIATAYPPLWINIA